LILQNIGNLDDLRNDIEVWERFIQNEKAVFERRLRSRSLTTDPSQIRDLDEKVRESDKALRNLSKQKLLAETRFIRAQNGDFA
jgi:hypothetical protein